MLKFEDLKENVDYLAVGDNGREYEAVYVNDYVPGGIVFCCHPDSVKLIGYKEAAK